MVQVGIVGAGFMAETHANAYERIPNATVAAVASPNTAGDFVEQHALDAEVFSDAERMYEEAELDAIDVCTPTPTHKPLVEAAARSGLDVLCEKPLARTIDEAESIAKTVREEDVNAMVGHVIRFFPDYSAIKRQAESGVIGDPGVARARRLSPFPDWGRNNWFADEEKSGGVFLDMSIHDFDYLRWLFGDVARVFARVRSWGDGQHGHAVLRFEGGEIGYVEGSTAQPAERGFRTDLEIAGNGGLLEYENTDPSPLIVTSEVDDADATGNLPETQLAEDGFHRQLAAFVDCVASGEEPPVPIDEAIEAMKISLAAIRSAETGEPVGPSEVAG